MADSGMKSSREEEEQVPFSILDTDLYKLTMQQAVYELFRDSSSEYRFTNRSPDMLFSRKTYNWVKERVRNLKNLHLTPQERTYLTHNCPYFKPDYLDYLEKLQLHPDEQVSVDFVLKYPADSSPNGHGAGKGEKNEREKREEGDEEGEDEMDTGLIELGVKGLWRECILYEVPLMAILSEGYFLHTVPTEWTHSPTQTRDLAAKKSYNLLRESAGTLSFSEFGTRRRRSYGVQKEVLEGLREGEGRFWDECGGRGGKVGGLGGTSNVHFAMMFGLKPVGTIAHEWIMAIGAKRDYDRPNGSAMDAWEQVYPAKANSPLHTMLTDTYTVDVFFREFLADPARASRWNALRHDSGDPVEFARKARATWDEIAMSSGEEGGKAKGRVIFSDGLDVDEALRIWRECEEIGINGEFGKSALLSVRRANMTASSSVASFGIGTHLTNDFHMADDPTKKSKPLNMVIKLRKMDGLECVKLSDDRGKWTGDREEVMRCRRILGLSDANDEGEAQEAPGMT